MRSRSFRMKCSGSMGWISSYSAATDCPTKSSSPLRIPVNRDKLLDALRADVGPCRGRAGAVAAGFWVFDRAGVVGAFGFVLRGVVDDLAVGAAAAKRVAGFGGGLGAVVVVLWVHVYSFATLEWGARGVPEFAGLGISRSCSRSEMWWIT